MKEIPNAPTFGAWLATQTMGDSNLALFAKDKLVNDTTSPVELFQKMKDIGAPPEEMNTLGKVFSAYDDHLLTL
jgi:hypothetical protein